MPVSTWNGLGRLESSKRKISANQVVVVYINNQAHGEEVAGLYRSARNIPSANVIGVDFSWDHTSDGHDYSPANVNDEWFTNVIDVVYEAVVDRNIHCIVLAGYWPESIVWLSTNTGSVTQNVTDLFFIQLQEIYQDKTELTWPTEYFPIEHWIKDYPSSNYRPCAFDYQFLYTSVRRYQEWLSLGGNNNASTIQRNTSYAVGDIHRYDPVGVGLPAAAGEQETWKCITAGTTGVSDPFWDGGGADDFVFNSTTQKWEMTDGTSVWEIYDFGMPKYRYIYGLPPYARIPLDHESVMKTITPESLIAKTETAHKYIPYVVTRLCCGEINPSDAFNSGLTASQVVSRQINDGIFVESKKYKAPVGKALFGQSVTAGYATSLQALYSAMAFGYSTDNAYWNDMSVEVSDLPAELNISGVTPATNYQAGDDWITVRDGKTFTDISDVFIHVLGNDSYYANNPPLTPSNVAYKRGAITIFGQSCGAGTPFYYEADALNGARNIQRATASNSTERDCISADASIHLAGDINGAGVPVVQFSRTATGVTTGTVEVTADNTIVLRDDGATVQTINVTPNQTAEEIAVELLNTTLAAEWTVSRSSCNFVESRCSRAIKNRAAVAMGSAVEPFIGHGAVGNGWIQALFYGLSLGEALRHFTPMNMYNYGKYSEPWYLKVYGDPLYTPFKGID